MKGGRKIGVMKDKLYVCNVCGQVFEFETAYLIRGYVDVHDTGKRAVRCFNPGCENIVVEQG